MKCLQPPKRRTSAQCTAGAAGAVVYQRRYSRTFPREFSQVPVGPFPVGCLKVTNNLIVAHKLRTTKAKISQIHHDNRYRSTVLSFGLASFIYLRNSPLALSFSSFFPPCPSASDSEAAAPTPPPPQTTNISQLSKPDKVLYLSTFLHFLSPSALSSLTTICNIFPRHQVS